MELIGTKDAAIPRPVSRVELACVALFAACNVIIPLSAGELYPFTVAPMFRDSPKAYCEYEVIGPDGAPLPLTDFQLQRNYDGNPVGFGAGVHPPPTFDEFGSAPSLSALRAHV